MIQQIKFLASWTSVKLGKRLGQRGAEMVEYAIVLACVAAVGVYFYANKNQGGAGQASNGLDAILTTLWGKVNTAIGKAQ